MHIILSVTIIITAYVYNKTYSNCQNTLKLKMNSKAANNSARFYDDPLRSYKEEINGPMSL